MAELRRNFDVEILRLTEACLDSELSESDRDSAFRKLVADRIEFSRTDVSSPTAWMDCELLPPNSPQLTSAHIDEILTADELAEDNPDLFASASAICEWAEREGLTEDFQRASFDSEQWQELVQRYAVDHCALQDVEEFRSISPLALWLYRLLHDYDPKLCRQICSEGPQPDLLDRANSTLAAGRKQTSAPRKLGRSRDSHAFHLRRTRCRSSRRPAATRTRGSRRVTARSTGPPGDDDPDGESEPPGLGAGWRPARTSARNRLATYRAAIPGAVR